MKSWHYYLAMLIGIFITVAACAFGISYAVIDYLEREDKSHGHGWNPKYIEQKRK